MKIQLPNVRRGGGAPAAQRSSGGTMTSEPVVIGGAGDRMRLLSRRLRGAAGYVALFLAVFFVFVWISLPTRAIAWRIGQEARDAGYIIEVEDLSISPFGGVTLYNVTWTFQPSHSGQIPRKLELPEVAVDVSLFKLMLGNYDIEVDTKIEDATIHAAYTRSADESTVKINIAELPLYDVPKLQQALNAPLVGLFALDVDLTLPENLFAKAVGSIDISCSGCKVGDGETPLYLPGAGGIMAKGVTLPEIDLGSLGGKLVVVDGKATTEQLETTSDDLTLKISGGMNLADPFSRSDFAFDMKLLITPALQDRSEPLKLLVQTAGPSTQLDPPEQDWLGFKLRGSAGRPKFTGIKTKSKEESNRERRQASLERDAKRKAARAKKEREAKAKAPVIAPLDDGSAAEAADPTTGERPSMDATQPSVDPAMVDQRRPAEDDAADPFAGDSKPAGARPEEGRPEEAQPEDTKQPPEAPSEPPSNDSGAGQGGEAGAQDGGTAGGQDGGTAGGQDGGAAGGQDGGAAGGQDGGAGGGVAGGPESGVELR